MEDTEDAVEEQEEVHQLDMGMCNHFLMQGGAEWQL